MVAGSDGLGWLTRMEAWQGAAELRAGAARQARGRGGPAAGRRAPEEGHQVSTGPWPVVGRDWVHCYTIGITIRLIER
jgi:hypothetical protein